MKSLNKIIAIITIIAATGIAIFPVAAQSDNLQIENRQNPVEIIERQSGGNIIIEVPDFILRQIMSEAETAQKKNTPTIRPGVNKMQGFRIQVFSDGRNQHSLEQRAKARGTAIANRFPKYRGQVYTYSSSPNWYARVGNFRTQQEATSALAELKRAFPQFASEMRVVKSPIVIISK